MIVCLAIDAPARAATINSKVPDFVAEHIAAMVKVLRGTRSS